MAKSEILKAQLREKLGSRPSKKLRSQGRIPATLEQEGSSPHVDLHIDEHEFLGTRRRHTHLYDIDIGGQVETALVRELQWDTLGDSILHIEFKRVRRDVKTNAEVELEFVGHPKGGMLNHLVTHVTVLCFPDQIPDSIEVPVSKLEPGGSFLARELTMPAGVDLVEPTGDYKIAVVVLAKIEVEPVPAAAAEAAPAAAGEAAPAPVPGGKAAPAGAAKTPPASAKPPPPGAKTPPPKTPPAKG